MKLILFILIFIGIPLYFAYPNLEKNDIKKLSINLLQTSSRLESFTNENMPGEKFSFQHDNFNFSKKVEAKGVTFFEITSITGLARMYWYTDKNNITHGTVYLGPKEEMMLYLTKTVKGKWIFSANQEDKIFKPENFSAYEKILADLRQIYRNDRKTAKIKPK